MRKFLGDWIGEEGKSSFSFISYFECKIHLFLVNENAYLIQFIIFASQYIFECRKKEDERHFLCGT